MLVRHGIVWGIILLMSGCAPSEPPVAGGKSIDHWLEMVEDQDPKVRVQAVEKLGNIGNKSKEGIDAIILALDDSEANVRKTAILAVVRNKSAWSEALPKLSEMAESDQSEPVKKLAAEAVQNLSK